MKNVDSMISMSKKAGKLVSGESVVEAAIKAEQVKLVIIATDASENTKKKFTNMCKFRNITKLEYQDKSHLGALIGKAYRATLAITDEGLANAIVKHFQEK